jgi:hypothetical protein
LVHRSSYVKRRLSVCLSVCSQMANSHNQRVSRFNSIPPLPLIAQTRTYFPYYNLQNRSLSPHPRNHLQTAVAANFVWQFCAVGPSPTTARSCGCGVKSTESGYDPPSKRYSQHSKCQFALFCISRKRMTRLRRIQSVICTVGRAHGMNRPNFRG